MTKTTITLKIKLLLKTEKGTIVVPRDNNGYIKTFLFKFPLAKLQELQINDNLEDIFHELMVYFYFYDFLADVGLYDIHITSILFELDGKEHDFSYASNDIYDNYWTDEVKLMLEEEFEQYGYHYGYYNFDKYATIFGMEKENYEYII